MEWTFDRIGDNKILRIKISGDLQKIKIIPLCVEALAETHKNAINKILVDLSENSRQFSTLDIYEVPQILESVGVSRHIKIAFLYENFPEDFIFFENVSQNRGFSFRLFKVQAKERAIAWLMEE